MGRAARLPPPVFQISLEAQFQENIRKSREDIQRAKDGQTAHILRWLRS
jgi:hypothetical protein